MCLIVDANLAGVVFSSPPSPNFVPVIDWLQKDGCLILGGKLGDRGAREWPMCLK
jgi:hypothetical protein